MWKGFKKKFEVNIPYNTHSGMPVISHLLQYHDMPVFRAHVLNSRLRKIDPYHIADRYVQPFWHGQHYFVVCEQVHTAAMKMLIADQYHKMTAKEVPISFNWKRPVLWNDNVSVDLYIETKGRFGGSMKQEADFSFYSDKTRRKLGSMHVMSYWRERTYVLEMRKIEQDKAPIDSLLRKIRNQEVIHSKLKERRKTLSCTADELEDRLAAGDIPHAMLHDYFSLWDPP